MRRLAALKLCNFLDNAEPWQNPREPFNALYSVASSTFKANFEMQWFKEVLEAIDAIFYNGLLLDAVAEKYGGIKLSFDIADDQIAGYVVNTKSDVTFCMNRPMFVSLFESKASYHSGGLMCADRLKCLLHVILHETVHLALLICRPSDIHHHSKEFNRLIFVLFGHTDSQHGLIRGLNPEYDLATIKTKLKRGQHVKVYLHEVWVPARIDKINRKTVALTSLRNARHHFTVHPGLIKF